MVEIQKIFEPNKEIQEKDRLFKAVKDFSEKIGESTGTSSFITVEDALNTGSEIFLIKTDVFEMPSIERNFIEA